MLRIALTYGTISGVASITVIMLGLLMADDVPSAGSQAVGYLIMLVALSIIFFGVKRHRDINCAGVIRFFPALGLGLLITAVAGVAYVIVWEIYLAFTGPAFIESYTAGYIDQQIAAGLAGEELEELRVQMATMVERYANPLFRIPITFTEILPVGVLISLISAAILRNPRVMPAR